MLAYENVVPVAAGDAQVALDIAEEGTEAFGLLSGQLAALRDAQMSLANDLEAFSQTARPPEQDGADMAPVLSAMEALEDGLRAYLEIGRDLDVAQKLGAAGRAAEQIERNGTFLTAVASITHTTAMSMGHPALRQYVEALGTMAGELQDSAGSVAALTVRLTSQEASSREDAGAAREALARAIEALAPQHDHLQALKAREVSAAGALDRAAVATKTRAHEELKSLITVMQFSDSMAQRLEHVRAILDRRDPTLARLAAAQARDIAREIDETADQTARAADAIRILARSALEHFGETDIAGALNAVIAGSEETIELAMARLAPVVTRVEASARQVKKFEETVEAANADLRNLERRSENIIYASINARLLTKDRGSIALALAPLASAVRETARECDRNGSLCSDRIGTVLGAYEGCHQSLSGRVTAMSDSLARCREGLSEGSRRLAIVSRLQDEAEGAGAVLRGSLESVLAAVEGIRALSPRITALALSQERLGQGVADPDSDVLAQIAASYTMASERQVQDALYPTAKAPADEPAPADDDLDDIFF